VGRGFCWGRGIECGYSIRPYRHMFLLFSCLLRSLIHSAQTMTLRIAVSAGFSILLCWRKRCHFDSALRFVIRNSKYFILKTADSYLTYDDITYVPCLRYLLHSLFTSLSLILINLQSVPASTCGGYYNSFVCCRPPKKRKILLKLTDCLGFNSATLKNSPQDLWLPLNTH